MTDIHNVRDGRVGRRYTSWRTLTSYRDGTVWARFSSGDTAAACNPVDLCFGVAS